MKLWKAHGLGNDYLVWEGGEPLNSNMVQAICHRHTGVGADGILEPTNSQRADLGLRIWNPDGSVAEKSGNGLRIFAWWYSQRQQGASEITVDTGTDVVRCLVNASENWVKVEMGYARFAPEDIPCTERIWNESYPVDGGEIFLFSVGMGNPHCVSFFEDFIDLDALNWREWGAALEKDERFPNRSNVQFARVISPSRIEIRIWERGAGETSASGSSSCAVAAVARKMGWIEPVVTMSMPGGELQISISSDGMIELQGPVEEIGCIELADGWFSARIC